jgi:nucleoside-diphosphate-sugar epimerase
MDKLVSSEFFENKRILITGASGYIAWNLIQAIIKFNCTIICFSRNAEKIEKQIGRATVEFVTASYQDEVAIEKSVENIDIIYHLASQTSVEEAESSPLTDYEANVRPMQLLLEACRRGGRCPTIIFSGTSTQCGIPKTLPVDECVDDEPITIYDFHKLQAENWLKYYTQQGWVSGVSFRLTNVYGPGPRTSSADRGVLNFMLKNALARRELTIWGSGKYIRDYIYVQDVVSVFLSAPNCINDLKGSHFVLGSGEGTTIEDAVMLITEIVGKTIGQEVPVKKIKEPSNMHQISLRKFIADTSTLKKLGVYEQSHSLRQGMTKSVKYMENFREKINSKAVVDAD